MLIQLVELSYRFQMLPDQRMIMFGHVDAMLLVMELSVFQGCHAVRGERRVAWRDPDR